MPAPALYQLMPALTPAELGALREDIITRGIIVPIVVDEHDVIIDGHHRARIAKQLDVPCPRDVRKGLTADEKADLAVALNFNRRSLTTEQKTRIIGELRASGWTQARIANAVGVSIGTVNARLKFNSENQPETITTSDGKVRPASYAPRASVDASTGEVAEPVDSAPAEVKPFRDPKPAAERATAAVWSVRDAIDRLDKILRSGDVKARDRRAVHGLALAELQHLVNTAQGLIDYLTEKD